MADPVFVILGMGILGADPLIKATPVLKAEAGDHPLLL
jgi:hypothetical protein